MIAPLQLEHITCQYNEKTRISHVKWVGIVTGNETAQGYEWGFRLIASVPADKPVLGTVIDFTEVQEFAPDNLRRARKESQNIRSKNVEVAQTTPTALVVANMHQEMYLYTSMRLADQNKLDNPLVKLVKSVEDGLAHIEQWHKQHEKSLT